MRASSKVVEAFSVLGLEEDASLEVVKTTYKQIALRTHPDKNPNNPSATAEFQRVGEAYRVLVKHLDESSKPSAGPRGGHPFFGFQRGQQDFYSDDEDDYDEEDYDSDYGDMEYYLWIFEQMMANRMYYARRDHANRRQAKHESPEEYQERLRRTREEQLAAQERRKRESEARKERAAREREQERIEAEQRQKNKVEAKKAQVEAARRSSEEKARALLLKAQETRSSVFSAARAGHSDKVKKGIWEAAVDAAGGEIKPGCAAYVKVAPKDPNETLLHIATRHGDLDLVRWLDSHSADPEERNAEGLTAFHLALKMGHLGIVNHFFETYPPKEPDSQPIYDSPHCSCLLSLALESREPELVWKILDHKMANPTDIHKTSAWASSERGFTLLKGPKPNAQDVEKAEDIVKLLTRYTTPRDSSKNLSDQPTVIKKEASASPQILPTPERIPPRTKQNNHRGRGRGRGRGRSAHSGPPAH